MSWEYMKLGDICTKIGSGATPKGGATVYVESGTSFIRSQNIYNLSFQYDGLVYINDEASEKLKGVKVEAKDVLLNITGDSVARTCIVPEGVLPARVNQHVAIIRPKKDIINPIFLNYYLASPFMQSYMLGLAVGKGASRNALTKMMIEDFEVPCPRIDLQEKIVDILSAYDDLIENNQKQIKLLEEAVQRLYKEWFVDLRFPGHENVEIIDRVPEGWCINRADHYFKITIGKTPSRAEKQWFTNSGEGTPWISISDMGEYGTFAFYSKEGLTADAIIRHNMKVVPKGTILVSFKLTVGRVAITSIDMCTNEAIAHFYIDNDLDRAYTYCYLKNFEYDSLGNTSSISKAINSKIIKSMPFIMPTGDILRQFSMVVQPILDQIELKQKIIFRLTEARDRLLPKIMSGEIKV
ncbi:MAG: restriction endonuclease subunit S [Veillonella sp.]